MARRKSPASAADAVAPTTGEAYGLALAWLGQRELSVAQVRQRLARRAVPDDVADDVVTRLTRAGVLDDARVAATIVRQETAIKGRGPSRIRARLRSAGVADATASAAVDGALSTADVEALLDRALEKRLRGASVKSLDAAAQRRLAGALVRQGFSPSAVFSRLRRRGADVANEHEGSG